MDNEEYAELLEKVAARIRKLDEPISQKTISAIGEVARDVIGEGRKAIELQNESSNILEGAVKVKEIDTPEYRAITEETDRRIEKAQRREADAWDNADSIRAR